MRETVGADTPSKYWMFRWMIPSVWSATMRTMSKRAGVSGTSPSSARDTASVRKCTVRAV